MEINIYAVLIWISGLLIGSTAITVFLGSNKLSSKAFSFSIAVVTLWIISCGFLATATTAELANIMIRINYFVGGATAASFLYFFYTFPNEKKPSSLLPISVILLQLIFFWLYFFSDTIIAGVFRLETNNLWGWYFGKYSFLFEVFFFSFYIAGIIILYKKYKSVLNFDTKNHLKYMLWVIIVGSIPPSLVSIILPRLGYFDLNWLGPVTEVFWIPIIAFSIVKYRLFNTRIIAIELVIFSLWIIILTRTFFAQNIHEVLIESSLLLIAVAFGILLIHSMIHERNQRERIESLAQDLKKAYENLHTLNDHLELKVAEQTIEIQQAYEVEKKARLELERLNITKDNFITSTQHHLRTPLTALKWEIESIAKNPSYKKEEPLTQSMQNMSSSISRLSNIIRGADFLAALPR